MDPIDPYPKICETLRESTLNAGLDPILTLINGKLNTIKTKTRDGEVPSKKELSSYFEELFISKVPRQKELSSSNEELFPNPDQNPSFVIRFWVLIKV